MESKKVNRKRTSFPSRGKRMCEEVGEREEQRDGGRQTDVQCT